MSVIEVDIIKRKAYAKGKAFGDTGAYERIDGVLTFGVDPENEANQTIVDLELAPRDSEGLVRFKSDFTLLVPQTPSEGNGRLIVDVVNRGRKMVVGTFNRAPAPPGGAYDIDPGDGFLFEHGFSVVSIGWQWDVYRSKALLGLKAPKVYIDRRPVQGQAVVEIRPNVVEKTRLLANRSHQPYPVADLNDPTAMLTVRDWEDGPDTVIPRDHWRFARETEDGVVESNEHIYLESGFQPGKIYYAIYNATNAVVVGTSLLAVRDVASWLKYPSSLNPVHGGFGRVYGYGVSQTGRLLRHFMYAGLNRDESGRLVYDGLMPHVAGGRRGEFNHRFAQPSQQSAPGFGQLFPFSDNETTDPYIEKSDGLLKKSRKRNAVPKIMYTNSSAEYWRGDGSLVHVDLTGQFDLEPAEESRIYHFAGTQHGAGSPNQTKGGGPDGSMGRYPFNVVDYRPLLRAALINLDRWVSEGTEPPPSKHPRLDDSTAITQKDLLESLDMIPELVKPATEKLWRVREVDLGPHVEKGIGRYPVKEGDEYPHLVAAVDKDGNELGGIRLPDLEVPVGTHAGWNLRDPETGAPEQLMSMQGFSNFFAPNAQARKATGDKRPSIQERYPSRDAYLKQVKEAARELASQRYILEEDIDIVVEACGERYDGAMSA